MFVYDKDRFPFNSLLNIYVSAKLFQMDHHVILHVPAAQGQTLHYGHSMRFLWRHPQAKLSNLISHDLNKRFSTFNT